MNYVSFLILLGPIIGGLCGGLEMYVLEAGYPLAQLSAPASERAQRGRWRYMFTHAVAGAMAGLIVTLLLLDPARDFDARVPITILMVTQMLAGLSGARFIGPLQRHFGR